MHECILQFDRDQHLCINEQGSDDVALHCTFCNHSIVALYCPQGVPSGVPKLSGPHPPILPAQIDGICTPPRKVVIGPNASGFALLDLPEHPATKNSMATSVAMHVRHADDIIVLARI